MHSLTISVTARFMLLLLSPRIILLHRPLSVEGLLEQAHLFFPRYKFTMYFFNTEVSICTCAVCRYTV